MISENGGGVRGDGGALWGGGDRVDGFRGGGIRFVVGDFPGVGEELVVGCEEAEGGTDRERDCDCEGGGEGSSLDNKGVDGRVTSTFELDGLSCSCSR